jgi:hypothetical protein
MESPLDEEGPDRRLPALWTALVGVVVGGLLVLGGYVVAGDGDADVGAVATTTSAPAPVTTSAAGFPAGYSPLNERIAVRPERVLFRDDTVFVSLSQAVLTGLDATETAGVGAGDWELIAAGTTYPMLTELRNVNAPGTLTVAFAAPGVAAGDLEALRLVGEGSFLGTADEAIFDVGGLPFDGPPGPWVIDLEPGAAFVVEEVVIDGDGGRLRWRLDGSAATGAVVAGVDVELFTAASPNAAAFMPPREFATFLGFFGSAEPVPLPTSSGVIELAPPIADSSLPTSVGFGGPDDVTGMRIGWTIDWVTMRPAAATVPLQGVATVEVGG